MVKRLVVGGSSLGRGLHLRYRRRLPPYRAHGFVAATLRAAFAVAGSGETATRRRLRRRQLGRWETTPGDDGVAGMTNARGSSDTVDGWFRNPAI